MDQNPRSVTGGPQDLPPPPGAGGQDTTKVPLSRNRKYLVFALVVVMSVTAVASYFGFRASKPTRSDVTMTITSPPIPGIDDPQTLSQVCSAIPELLASASVINASAMHDIATGAKTLPSVNTWQLSEVITGLQSTASSAPEPLASAAKSYAAYFVRLRGMKSGSTSTDVTTSDSALLAAKIASTCRNTTP